MDHNKEFIVCKRALTDMDVDLRVDVDPTYPCFMWSALLYNPCSSFFVLVPLLYDEVSGMAYS